MVNKLLHTLKYWAGLEMYTNKLPAHKAGSHHGVLTVAKPNNRAFNLYCGSYFSRPMTIPGIKLAPEILDVFDYSLAIEDYSTPTLAQTLLFIEWLNNKSEQVCELYLGCYGGYGRTGLIASVILVAFEGITAEEAVERVRKNVHPNCVETPAQFQFVRDFDDVIKTAGLAEAIRLAKLNLI